MPLATKFEGETCSQCGSEDLVYWTKDETESTLEAYMDCRNCGREYSKVFMDKSEDTSDEAVREALRKRL